MYKAILLPPTKEDIKEAAIWYDNRQKGLGRRFTAQVREKVRYICQHPQAAPIRYDAIRTAVLDIFPFMIHYTLDEQQQIAIITGVFHTSRDPGSWRR